MASDPQPQSVRGGGLKPPAVRYLGFRVTSEGREYSLRATEGLDTRHFVVLITHQVFSAHEVSFQDAPDLCFATLQRELAVEPELVTGSRLVVTARELLEHRDARQKRPSGRKRSRSAS